MDFIARGRPDVYIPPAAPLITAVTAGLMGTFNAILLSFDPSVVAVIFWPHWRKQKEQERRRRNMKAARLQLEPPASHCKPLILGDIEMAETKVAGNETQGVVVTTIHLQSAADHGLELQGHSAIPNGVDLENSGTSTIGYDMSDLAKIYHGL
jgi:hypothetical protein